MGQDLGLDSQPGVFPLSDRLAEMGGFPVNDDGGEQVEPVHSVVLALAQAFADFAPAHDPECVLEGVMSLALVQAGAGPALHTGVEQPVDDDERSLHPSDFAESDGQFVLARIGADFRSSWLGGRAPLARVAATRRMSGQFRTITSSRSLVPVNPVSGFGTRPGSRTCGHFDGRSRRRGVNR